MKLLVLWSGCCDDVPGSGAPPPDYDGPARTPALMRKYRFVVGPGVAIDGSGEVPPAPTAAVTSGPYHMYDSPLLLRREPADNMTSFGGGGGSPYNVAPVAS